MKKKLQYLLPPFLVSLYPVLSLSSFNLLETTLVDFFFVAAIVIAGVSFILGLTYLVYKNLAKASLFSTYLLLFLFYFHHGLEKFNDFTIDTYGSIFFKLRYILLVFFIISAFIFYKIFKAKNISARPFNLITIFFCVLISFSIIKTVKVSHTIQNNKQALAQQNNKFFNVHVGKKKPLPQNLPDIYFILPDMYVSEWVLQKYFNSSNRWFLKSLEQKGFYVMDKSRSNYPCTLLSIPATLNLRYHSDNMPFQVKDNVLFRLLKSYGYSVHTSSLMLRTFSFLRHQSISSYLKEKLYFLMGPFSCLNAFLRFKTFLYYAPSKAVNKLEQYQQQQSILYQLDELKKSVALPGPKFVFCHLLCPHFPWAFDEQGNFLDYSLTREEAYAKQVQFISKKLDDVVDYILKTSPKPPVIVMQSDHGFRSGVNTSWTPEHTFVTSYSLKKQYPILNAWYVPDDQKQLLYKSMSPVNTFRLLLDQYLETKLGLLKDESFMYHRESQNEIVFAKIDDVLDDPKDRDVSLEKLFESKLNK